MLRVRRRSMKGLMFRQDISDGDEVFFFCIWGDFCSSRASCVFWSLTAELHLHCAEYLGMDLEITAYDAIYIIFF